MNIESIQTERLLIDYVLEAALLFGGAAQRVGFANGAGLSGEKNRKHAVSNHNWIQQS